MKLFNVVVVYDVYAAAENEDDAAKAVLAMIASGELAPSEHTAIQVTHERSIRSAWLEEKPFVGAEVSDEDFALLKGKTTIEAYQMLHTKVDSPAVIEQAKEQNAKAKAKATAAK